MYYSVTIKKLSERKTRLEYRIERFRSAIEKGMAAGELTSLKFPEATLSLRSVPPKLEIENEAEIPPEYWKPQPPKIDKKEIAETLAVGMDVPGARMSNGSQSLIIRRS